MIWLVLHLLVQMQVAADRVPEALLLMEIRQDAVRAHALQFVEIAAKEVVL